MFAFFRSKETIPGKEEAEHLLCAYLEEKLIDSMGIVEMITEFEEQWGIYFEPRHMQSAEFRTIGGLIGLIENLIQEPFHSTSRASAA